MSAEWEPQQAVWTAGPHNTSDWPSKFNTALWDFAEMVRIFSQYQPVRILVLNERHEKSLRRNLQRIGTNMDRVEFYRIPTDRVWTRDYMPAFVEATRENGDKEQRAVLFEFNGWARYDDHEADRAAGLKAAEALSLPVDVVVHEGCRVVLEGGALDVNGQGSILVTEECLLDEHVQVRNPGFTRKDYEQLFARYLGADNTIWLNRGICGDDTHGHVDDICRFVNPSTIVLVRAEDAGDPDYTLLEENRERLESVVLEDGSKPEVVLLPTPQSMYFDGMRLPAGYANFYIGNGAVFVPTYNDPKDRIAMGILQELFPERQVRGINCSNLILGQGALHCMTHEHPRAPVSK